jgi:hypothetical protein
MRQQFWKPIILSMASLSLTALVPLTVCAQDPKDEHREQRADEHQDNQPRRDERQDEQPRRDEHQDDQMRRGDHHDDNQGDQAGQYRHDHPGASARCQDGFFTTTRDRSRACSRHGGVDVWIAN